METPLQFQPPDKTRIVDRVYRSIEDEILTGRTHPGERLIEQTLCQQLRVSRTTVREALLMLEREGLVESTPRGGTFVAQLSSAAARDLSTMRALLEGYAVRRAFADYDSSFFTALCRLTMEMDGCVLPHGVPRLIELDIAFHALLVKRAHSAHLMELWTRLNGKLRALYLLHIERFDVTTTQTITALHEQLVDDLASGDIDRAQRGVMRHYMGWDDAETDQATMEDTLTLFAE